MTSKQDLALQLSVAQRQIGDLMTRCDQLARHTDAIADLARTADNSTHRHNDIIAEHAAALTKLTADLDRFVSLVNQGFTELRGQLRDNDQARTKLNDTVNRIEQHHDECFDSQARTIDEILTRLHTIEYAITDTDTEDFIAPTIEADERSVTIAVHINGDDDPAAIADIVARQLALHGYPPVEPPEDLGPLGFDGIVRLGDGAWSYGTFNNLFKVVRR